MNTQTQSTLAFGHFLMSFSDALQTRARTMVSEADIIARLDAGEDYGEGTPLERDILAHVRFTGKPIEYTDKAGNYMLLDDVESMGGSNA